MNTFGMLVAAAFMLMGIASAFPNELALKQEKMFDSAPPQKTITSQSLEAMGIEMCPDKLHMCPRTAKCCQKENGTWGCCSITEIYLGECCAQWGIFFVCCPSADHSTQCRWYGCTKK